MNTATVYANLRFLFISANLAYNVARRFNGPFHPLTRELASRLEFAHARFSDAISGLRQ